MIATLENAKKTTVFEADPSWKGIYRTGGLALLAAGLLYLIGSTCGSYLGVPPANSQAYLQSLADHPVMAQVTYWIFGFADLFFIPAILSLYLALKGTNKNVMLIAVGLLGFFIILDLGISELNSLVLVNLTQKYAAATDAIQQGAYRAAENWGLATMPVATFFSWIGPSCGFLIISFVMLNSSFGRNTARLGMIANGLGIVASFYFILPLPAVLSLMLTPILVVYGVWLIAAGRRLYKLGR